MLGPGSSPDPNIYYRTVQLVLWLVGHIAILGKKGNCDGIMKKEFFVTNLFFVRHRCGGGEKVTDFQEVYNLYFRDVYRYALSLCRNESVAEEITQDTFYKALAKLDSFDGKCKVSVWLCQIAKNTYISMCRKDKHLDSKATTSLLTSDDSIEDSFMQKEMAFAIHKVLHTLDEPYKEVFSLRTFGELTFKQIAELFGRTETWARVTYHRARLKIKEELK